MNKILYLMIVLLVLFVNLCCQKNNNVTTTSKTNINNIVQVKTDNTQSKEIIPLRKTNIGVIDKKFDNPLNSHLGEYIYISEKDFNKLNLSKDQMSKFKNLELKWLPPVVSANEYKRFFKKRQEDIINDFRSILNEKQKIKFDEALQKNIEKDLKDLKNNYFQEAIELEFSEKQYKQLDTILKNYNGNKYELAD